MVVAIYSAHFSKRWLPQQINIPTVLESWWTHLFSLSVQYVCVLVALFDICVL